MPAPSNKKKPAKKTTSSTTSTSAATATSVAAIVPSTPPSSTLQPPISLSTATTAPEPQLLFDFAFFLNNASSNDISQFVDAVSTTKEGRNLELLWKRAYEEGYEKGRGMLLEGLEREMGEMFEEGVKKGMNLGREEGYTVAKEGFDGIVEALKARKTPSNTATTQTEPQFDQSNDVNTQTDPLPLLQHPPTIVDPSPSPLTTKNAPGMSVATSSDSTSLEIETHHPFRATTPPVPPPQNATADRSDEPEVKVPPMFLPPPPKYEPRDLSVLRSSSPAPFSSLARRSKRSYTRHRQSRQSHHRYATFRSHSNCPQHFTATKKSVHSKIPPSSSFPVATPLDWDQDPRLSNLSRALKALGWVRNF